MKTITMLDLRRRTASILGEVAKGQRFLLTYRGRPAMRLEPVRGYSGPVDDDDPFYRLADLATDKGASLTNREIDKAIAGRL